MDELLAAHQDVVANRVPQIVQTPGLECIANGNAAVERSFCLAPPLERSVSLAKEEATPEPQAGGSN